MIRAMWEFAGALGALSLLWGGAVLLAIALAGCSGVAEVGPMPSHCWVDESGAVMCRLAGCWVDDEGAMWCPEDQLVCGGDHAVP